MGNDGIFSELCAINPTDTRNIEVSVVTNTFENLPADIHDITFYV